ncbi:MAG: hypothetical protein AAB955_02865 [Patescibacteria group bacterium]
MGAHELRMSMNSDWCAADRLQRRLIPIAALLALVGVVDAFAGFDTTVYDGWQVDDIAFSLVGLSLGGYLLAGLHKWRMVVHSNPGASAAKSRGYLRGSFNPYD